MTKNRKALTTSLVLAALVNGSGCMSETAKPEGGTAFRVIYEDAHCPFTGKQLQALHSAAEVTSLFATEPALKTHIGAPTNAVPEALGDALANADFSRETWILVAWGTQPNPGYRPVTTGTQVRFADGTLQLPLRMQAPDADAMQAQMIVTPCQLLSVALKEPVERIELR